MKYISQKGALGKANVLLIISISLILALSIIVAIPYISTKSSLINTADIGSAIGGSTAPIVGMAGAILVFFALSEQVKANLLTQKQINQQSIKESLQNESNNINQLYTNLKSSIDNFSYSTLDTYQFGEGHYTTGSEAIYKLFHDFYCDCHIDESELNGNPKITELLSILEICNTIFEKLNNSSIADKETIWTLTKHQFRYRIYPRGLGSKIRI